MAEPLTPHIPSGEITLGTTLTELTFPGSMKVLTILEASADIRVAVGPGLSDAGAAPTNYIPVPAAKTPYPVLVASHGFVALFADSGTPTCRVIVESP